MIRAALIATCLLAPAWAAGAPVLCPHYTPKSGQWHVVRGFGKGDRPTAFKMARAQAVANLRERMRAAYPKLVVDATVKELNTTLVDPEYDAQRQEACVLGIVRKTDLPQRIKRATAELDAALAKTVSTVNAKLSGKARLAVRPPTWAGAPAGALGKGQGYRLVAVAFPAARAFPKGPTDQPRCIARNFSGADFKGAAFDTLEYAIRPLGAPGCPNNKQTRAAHAQVLAAINSFPPCP